MDLGDSPTMGKEYWDGAVRTMDPQGSMVELENVAVYRMVTSGDRRRVDIDGLDQDRPFDVTFPSRFKSVGELAWFLHDMDESAAGFNAEDIETTTAGYEKGSAHLCALGRKQERLLIQLTDTFN